jgi:hypothetical protein
LPFLASQIVYNIDEVIDLTPHEEWEKVEMGYGSKQAMSWLQQEGHFSNNMTCLKAIKRSVSELSEEKLDCLGLRRLKKGKNEIVWKANLRIFGIQDSEHFLCKLWIVIVKRAGGRPSKNPKLHCSHLHPLKIPKNEADKFFGQQIMDIAKNSTEVFRKSNIKIPEFMSNW